MNQNFSLGKLAKAQRKVTLLALAFFALAESVPFLGAQSALPTPPPTASDTASNASSAAPLPFGAPSVPNNVPASLFKQASAEVPVFGYSAAAFPFSSRCSDFTTTQGSCDLYSPFAAGAGFESSRSHFSGLASFGGGLQPAGFSPFAVTSLDVRKGGFASLFPVYASESHDRSGMATEPFGAAQGTPPPLSQFMRGSIKLPVASSFSNFRPSSRDSFSFGSIAPGSEVGRAPGSAMFTTPDLGGGMFLSAGTSSGGRPAGAPLNPLGNATGGSKRPGPSLAIKLSF
jgi:hypothetical protein